MNLKEQAHQDILNGKYTLVVLDQTQENILFSSNDSGIKGLLKLVRDNKEDLKNSCIVDKVIGSAAAFLMAYAEIDSCYGLTMSERACDIFEGNRIRYSFDKEVPVIMKNETEMCMMEKMVIDLKTKEDAFETLCNFFK